jgi:flagellar basal body-associated protein FliL
MGKLKTWLIFGAACLVAGTVGFFGPQVLVSWLSSPRGEALEDAAVEPGGRPSPPGKESSSRPSPAAEDDSKSLDWRFIRLEKGGRTTVVNLNEERLTRYLSVAITVEADGRKVDVDKVRTKLDENRPKVRNTITEFLASKKVSEVQGGPNIAHLREEIKKELNKLLFPDEPEKIKAVYFEEFSIQ